VTEDVAEKEVERQLAVIHQGAEAVLGEEELREKLRAFVRGGSPLRVKLGVDPSAPDLHLGHTVVIQKLKRFQELGHTPIFLIGDFTARIGDPSGKKKTRPSLAPELIRKNAQTYLDQVGRVLDVQRAEIRFNSEWMEPMSSSDFIRLCSHYTVARLLERDDFAKRYAAGEPIAGHEFLYPFVQAYDSVALRCDVELGGSDQRFNLLMAREIQRAFGQAPQAVAIHPLLVGTEGRDKMSKSLGNTIGIQDPPEEIYGKIMSLSDALMLTYLERLGFGDWEDLEPARQAVAQGGGDPLTLKHELARRLVERFYGAAAGKAAADHFRQVVQRKEVPDDLSEKAIALGGESEIGLLDLLERLALIQSRGEGRRLIAEGAIQVDGARVSDPTLRLREGAYLMRVGRRRYARVRLS